MNYDYRITGDKDRFYDSFYQIYSTSFPDFEQRDSAQQLYAFGCGNYHLQCTVKDDTLLSFVGYWEFEGFIYIEHFAVNPQFRGESIGTTVLRNFIESKQKAVLLEIDPLKSEIAEKRFRFYQKLGFVDNPYTHLHPPYKKGNKPHRLLVLSYPDKIDEELYNSFYDRLKNEVMAKV